MVRNNHPDPLFFETTYAEIPFATLPLLNIKKEPENNLIHYTSTPLSMVELDNFIHGILENPALEASPPDQLASVTYTWHGDDLDQINKMANMLPATIVRAKGFVQENGVIYLFSYVMGDWAIEVVARNVRDIQHMNMVVYIGNFAAIEDIGNIITPPNWSAGKVLQPFGQIGKVSR